MLSIAVKMSMIKDRDLNMLKLMCNACRLHVCTQNMYQYFTHNYLKAFCEIFHGLIVGTGVFPR